MRCTSDLWQFPTADLVEASDSDKTVRFDFDVKIPAPLYDSEPDLFIHKLWTNFTNVHHRVDDLGDRLKFGSVEFRTTYMPIAINVRTTICLQHPNE